MDARNASPKSSSTQRVSVVIASYNMGRFLPSAIRSVLEQTYPAHDIHVVDDGSTDGTREAMREFSGVPEVTYHFQPNRGQASAKNRGILACHGDFIAFLDADDLWTRNKLEVQMPAFDSHPAVGVVYTNFAHIDERGTILGSPERQYYSGRISGRLLVDNFVNGMASVVRRECLDKVGTFDESLPMGIDYDLWLRISAEYEFLFVDEVTYLYRQWSGQMSHNRQRRMDCAIAIMKKFLAEHPGLVDRGTVNEAWAHTYVTRGYGVARLDRDKATAFKDYLRALSYRPTYLPAWKAIARLVLR